MKKSTFRGGLLIITLCLAFAAPSRGYDVTDEISIGGILAGAYQYQTGDNLEKRDGGALSFQPEFSFHPNERHEIFFDFAFAAGNGINAITEFNLAPWGADLEDDVKSINGRNRDYLLTAWYKHTFRFSDTHSLGLTGGIVDSTTYVDQNAFANDENTQFMNEALANSRSALFPGDDVGGVVEWEIGSFDVTALGMNVGENEDGNNYNYFAGQIGYRLETLLGQGNYRWIVELTSREFLDKDGNEERLLGTFLSCDQELGEIFGVWIRFGWQDDKALVEYDYLLSGGINITGKWYGREYDNIGVGYAYLNGGDDSGFDYTQVAEAYWRFVLHEYFALTADLQYMADECQADEGDISGVILGIRGTVEF